jgi:hypothetical protein
VWWQRGGDRELRNGAAICMQKRRWMATNLTNSHAYTECRHVAQCFALPKFGGTQHDLFDSKRPVKIVVDDNNRQKTIIAKDNNRQSP